MFDKRPQSVVDRLSRDRTDSRTDIGFDEFGGAVGLLGHRFEDRHALRGHLKALLAKEFLWFDVHGGTL